MYILKGNLIFCLSRCKRTSRSFVKCREILSNICDKKLCKNDLQLKTADYFQRIVTPLMPYRVLNKALDAEVNSRDTN